MDHWSDLIPDGLVWTRRMRHLELSRICTPNEYPIKYNIVLYNVSWKFTKTIFCIYDIWFWNGSFRINKNITYYSSEGTRHKGRIHHNILHKISVECHLEPTICITYKIVTTEKALEMPGIDPGTSRMLSERSTIWATPPWYHVKKCSFWTVPNFWTTTEVLAWSWNPCWWLPKRQN